METQDWDSIAGEFSDRVFQITDHDTDGVILSTAQRLGSTLKHAGDFGCGAGAVTRLLAGHFGKVTGLDQSAGLVREAEQATAADNVEYVHADLARPKPLGFRFDVSFCVNVLINRNHDVREKIARNVAAHTKRGGPAVFVVPSLESTLRTYQTVVDCQVRGGIGRSAAVRSANRQAGEEIESVVDGIVSVGDSPTKHFLSDELEAFLAEAGFDVQSMVRVQFPWNQEIDNPPRSLGPPTPWDWLAECRRR
ncbi:MAG: class I SAM-dependent methyltransferase [Acidobacteria bacterium]|uniref:Class I SAM-dependent methyltransferase n=1 Tax=Candidatus Polarisedimenticola svalbardensis TaxID=2886004 RepID=A0A8J6XPW8_9BACT|nr:class I SAM-dependent methyltransferase [Candidatus Polarisedimenticola svalbardensis]